jgi:LAS superfamily LD-carboxypeptidase LdcB
MSDALSTRDLDELELTGRARTHVAPVPELGCTLHPGAAAAFRLLKSAAAAAGFALEIVSGFRDFERQCGIWNGKYRGERPLLGRDGEPLAPAALGADELVDAILIWSALPGASRHHWGSELDVIDRAALPAGHRARLVPEEYAAGGPFAALDGWLAEHLARFGFFRPYTTDRGGVQPEPWHLSYAPVSVPAQAALTPAVLRRALEATVTLEGRERILERLEALHARYVAAVDPAPVALLQDLDFRTATRPS